MVRGPVESAAADPAANWRCSSSWRSSSASSGGATIPFHSASKWLMATCATGANSGAMGSGSDDRSLVNTLQVLAASIASPASLTNPPPGMLEMRVLERSENANSFRLDDQRTVGRKELYTSTPLRRACQTHRSKMGSAVVHQRELILRGGVQFPQVHGLLPATSKTVTQCLQPEHAFLPLVVSNSLACSACAISTHHGTEIIVPSTPAGTHKANHKCVTRLLKV